MRDPFANYDAWLEAPLRAQERMEAVAEQRMEAWMGSDQETEAFDEWMAELNPADDLPVSLYTDLFQHFRTTGHHALSFQKFCEDQDMAEEEAAAEAYAEARADWESNMTPWEE